MSKKPWRTVKIFGPTGRFTRHQIRKAIREVREQREQAVSAAPETSGTVSSNVQSQMEERANSSR